MNYTGLTEADQKEMLKSIGLSSMEELFNVIPDSLKAKSFNFPEGLTEWEVLQKIKFFARKNKTGTMCFLGSGIYDHIVPSTVDFLASRSEFVTSYTPYQPECSQGTLQSLFEFQTMMCRLTGMEVSNASMYDGATALAESALMAIRITNRTKIIVDQGVNPLYRSVLKTYLKNHIINLEEIPIESDLPNGALIIDKMDSDTAALIVQSPNFFGSIFDYSGLAKEAHKKGALLIAVAYPMSLGVIKSPGEMEADIVTGDGQSLGIPMQFGGPSFGFITTRRDYMRNLPGRIVGETVDNKGRRGFVLTLQAREQHIRRQKATSNICTNQSLCALRALFYLSLAGREGFREVGLKNHQNAEYLKNKFEGVMGVSVWNKADIFNEFVIELPVEAEKIIPGMIENNVLPGLPLSCFYKGFEKRMLVSVTEKRTKEEMDYYAAILEAVLWK